MFVHILRLAVHCVPGGVCMAATNGACAANSVHSDRTLLKLEPFAIVIVIVVVFEGAFT